MEDGSEAEAQSGETELIQTRLMYPSLTCTFSPLIPIYRSILFAKAWPPPLLSRLALLPSPPPKSHRWPSQTQPRSLVRPLPPLRGALWTRPYSQGDKLRPSLAEEAEEASSSEAPRIHGEAGAISRTKTSRTDKAAGADIARTGVSKREQ
ncbi:hypothetical protein NL676_030102 [Syzygium grande]|nr:hypothetical protein NL676_030102 [Syzygium grande]